MSWGALILGHAHPDVVRQATRQIEQGSTFGITTEVEGPCPKNHRVGPVRGEDSICFFRYRSDHERDQAGAGYTRRSLIVKFTATTMAMPIFFWSKQAQA